MDSRRDTTIEFAAFMGTIIGFVALVCLYGLLATGGAWLVSMVGLRSVLGRSLMTIAFGAAQLLATIQLLSLFRGLTGFALLLVNAVLTLFIGIIRRRYGQSRSKLARNGTGVVRVSEILRRFKQYPYEGVTVVAALLIVIWFVGLGFLMFPMTDSYHFAMPLFWKQHATIAPYPVANPRPIAVVFASEALCFPGQLYLRTNAMFPLLSGVALGMTIWTVTMLGVQLGNSFRSSITAGVTLLGYSATVYGVTGGSPEVLVAAMWFAASLYLLLESRSSGTTQTPVFGCSIFCFLMACGAKNVVVLQGPAYVLGVVMLLRNEAFTMRVMRTVLLWGAAGLICSSVLWSYTANLVWFGTPRGHVVVSETVSKDLTPTAVWTRVSRMTAGALIDPIWLPGSLLQPYRDTIKEVVKWSGARETLSEDNDPYYSFTDENLRPGKGMGFLGILVFIPGLVTAVIGLSRGKFADSRQAWVSLLIITLGSFLTYYALLRWQPPGITRMMLSCIAAGTPLCCLLLEKRGWRVLSMAVLAFSVALFSVYCVGMVSRRISLPPNSKIARVLSRIQSDRSDAVEYQWSGEEPRILNMKESYSVRELAQLFLSRVPESAAVGVVGGANTEEYFFFGDKLSHKVVPLIDCRFPGQFLPVPPEIDYITVQDFDLDSSVLRNYPDFDVWLRVQREGKTAFSALRRRQSLDTTKALSLTK